MRATQSLENSREGSRVYRACDLPIYPVAVRDDGGNDEETRQRNAVEEQIRNTRVAVQGFIEKYRETYDEAKQVFDTGVEHSKSTLDFVQNNPGELPRVAFITVGSLGGFILGYRGSVFRKLLYGTVAGVSCAALCYPQNTLELSKQGNQQLLDMWQEFSLDELKQGNWPFVKDESTDEENRKKLGLPKDLTNQVVKELTNEVALSTPPPTPVEMKGDPGQANPDDQDMYSTRSS